MISKSELIKEYGDAIRNFHLAVQKRQRSHSQYKFDLAEEEKANGTLIRWRGELLARLDKAPPTAPRTGDPGGPFGPPAVTGDNDES